MNEHDTRERPDAPELLRLARAKTIRIAVAIEARFGANPEAGDIWSECEVCWFGERHRRKLDFAETVKASDKDLVPVWSACGECDIRKRMELAGVPQLYLPSKFDNWEMRDKRDGAAKTKATIFAEQKRGFLMIASPEFGNGKTHLAVAILREFVLARRRSRFITQGEVLLSVRDRYHDRNAEDIVRRLKEVPFLLVDDIGVSVGGRDEKPTLYEILSTRYVDLRPTVLTTNLTPDEFREMVGERMASRLREATFAWVEIHAKSGRKEARKQYIGA